MLQISILMLTNTIESAMVNSKGGAFIENTAIKNCRNFEIVGLGIECADKTRVLKSFVREYYRIHFMINGSAYLKKPSSHYKVLENCGFIIFPGEAVNYNQNPSNPCEYFWCAIKGNDIQTILNSLHITRESPIFISKLKKYDMYVLINNIFSSYLLKKAGFNQSLTDFFNSIQVKDDSNNSKSPAFEKALEYIHQNYENELTISTISAKLSIDRTYLYKLFKKTLGISPQQYLIDHRISKAHDLLQTTNISIGEIALTVGFSSFSDFSKQFKKRWHMTASQFRNTYCN